MSVTAITVRNASPDLVAFEKWARGEGYRTQLDRRSNTTLHLDKTTRQACRAWMAALRYAGGSADAFREVQRAREILAGATA